MGDAARRDESGEWEYEYDAEETEDFYLTIDLTTYVPEARSRKQRRPTDHAEQGAADTSKPDIENDAAAPESVGTLQVLDLHTLNPLIKFDDGIYSCAWSTDYGTQLYVASTGTVDGVRWSGNVLDVIGLSQARLVARPTNIIKRSATVPASTRRRPSVELEQNLDSTGDAAYEGDAETPPTSASKPPLATSREQHADSNSAKAASFLGRLSQIKRHKGETDHVPFKPVRNYEPPSAEVQAAIRAAALRADAADGRVNQNAPITRK